MILETLQPVLIDFASFYKQIDDDHSHLLSIFSSLFVLYLSWRVWTFTIFSWVYPQEPRIVPYWIPGQYLEILNVETILAKAFLQD